MPRWEYIKISLSDAPRRTDDIDLLSDLGRAGWELVTIAINNVAYLKREVTDPARTRSRPRGQLKASDPHCRKCPSFNMHRQERR